MELIEIQNFFGEVLPGGVKPRLYINKNEINSIEEARLEFYLSRDKIGQRFCHHHLIPPGIDRIPKTEYKTLIKMKNDKEYYVDDSIEEFIKKHNIKYRNRENDND